MVLPPDATISLNNIGEAVYHYIKFLCSAILFPLSAKIFYEKLGMRILNIVIDPIPSWLCNQGELVGGCGYA